MTLDPIGPSRLSSRIAWRGHIDHRSRGDLRPDLCRISGSVQLGDADTGSKRGRLRRRAQVGDVGFERADVIAVLLHGSVKAGEMSRDRAWSYVNRTVDRAFEFVAIS